MFARLLVYTLASTVIREDLNSVCFLTVIAPDPNPTNNRLVSPLYDKEDTEPAQRHIHTCYKIKLSAQNVKLHNNRSLILLLLLSLKAEPHPRTTTPTTYC